MEQQNTWNEYYKGRVRNNNYISAFGDRYSRFIDEIIINIKRTSNSIKKPIILKEEGCGIGTVSIAISKKKESFVSYLGLTDTSEIKDVAKIILSDISTKMLELCYKNTNPVFNEGFLNKVPLSFSRENICEEKFFESPTIVVTHGVLEHFSDVDITKIMSTYNNDNVLFQAHYVPTNRYKTPSFGDERLLPIETWISLVNPDYYILDNNECDLYMFKLKSKNKN